MARWEALAAQSAMTTAAIEECVAFHIALLEKAINRQIAETYGDDSVMSNVTIEHTMIGDLPTVKILYRAPAHFLIDRVGRIVAQEGSS